jgi:hypothetical protein
MAVYKIRNAKGLYSTGGHSPRFMASGKTWSTLGHVRGHLTDYCNATRERRQVPEDWVVVMFAESRELGPARVVHMGRV